MHNNSLEAGPYKVLCQKWEEVEVGWGERPDGFSLHLSYGGLVRYILQAAVINRAYPEEYSRPCGLPYYAGVDEVTFSRVQAAEDGLYFNSIYDYPGFGGIDGWIQRKP